MNAVTPAQLASPAVNDLVGAMAVPAWVHRGAFVLRANDAAQRLLGHDEEVLLSTDHLSLVVAEDREELGLNSARCLRNEGETPAQALRLLARDGTIRQVEMTSRVIEWNGAPAALVTCVDHSDIRHVLDSLQTMGELLRQIVDGAPVASFVIDANHRVTHWNTACELLTGWQAKAMIGSDQSWRAFYSESRPLLADLMVSGAGVDTEEAVRLYGGNAKKSAMIPGGYESEAFFSNLGPDGRWLFFTAAPLRDREGRVVGAIETLHDIGERRCAEQELTRHRNELEQLVEERSTELASSARELTAFIDNAPIGVAYTVSGKVRRSNRKFGEIFGIADGAALGRPASAFFLSPEAHAELGQMAAPQLVEGLPFHHEMWMRHEGGKPIWTQLSAHVANPRDPAAGTWWMLQDRTDIRSAQEDRQARLEQSQETNRKLEETQNQLLQADKMASIGQLAAGVAHEINNPIGFVSSNLNTLREYVGQLLVLVDAYAADHADAADATSAGRLSAAIDGVELEYLKEDLPQLLDESADGLARVKKIVEDLKDFSRVDQPDWQQADLNVGLESTLNVVRHEVKYKAEIVKRLTPLPSVTCLPGQLNQVFMNLIVNASHAIAGRGVITLSSGAEDGWVWVQVDDTGCGMSEDIRRRIFEPFYTTKDVGKGTGLGLSLSFSIVQRHGGVIQVKSVPNTGSSFRVWVPIFGPALAGTAAPTVAPEWC